MTLNKAMALAGDRQPERVFRHRLLMKAVRRST